jgi:3-phenylpropionate/trans-cinnamate dioxygenase ferredoxin reductase component
MSSHHRVKGVDRVVVVGAGLAGMHTVNALRTQGFAGELVLFGAEPYPPYDRPPLSKAVLLGEADSVALPFDPSARHIDLRLDVRATGLGDGVVETTRGVVAYDGLVIATGAEPIRLPGDGALYLRTRDDALALRAALRPGAFVVIIGAGWIGAEVATAARTPGRGRSAPGAVVRRGRSRAALRTPGRRRTPARRRPGEW